MIYIISISHARQIIHDVMINKQQYTHARSDNAACKINLIVVEDVASINVTLVYRGRVNKQ